MKHTEQQLIDLLSECKLQLEYLNEKFPSTGTTNALIARLAAAIENASRTDSDKPDSYAEWLNETRNKLQSMRLDENEVEAMGRLQAYGYTDCINDLLEWLHLKATERQLTHESTCRYDPIQLLARINSIVKNSELSPHQMIVNIWLLTNKRKDFPKLPPSICPCEITLLDGQKHKAYMDPEYSQDWIQYGNTWRIRLHGRKQWKREEVSSWKFI